MGNPITFEQLNIDWNADSNAPELNITVNDIDVIIEFYLDTFEH